MKLTHRLRQFAEFLATELVVAVGIKAFEQFAGVRRAFATSASLRPPFSLSATHLFPRVDPFRVVQLAIAVFVEFFQNLLPKLAPFRPTGRVVIGHRRANKNRRQDQYKTAFESSHDDISLG